MPEITKNWAVGLRPLVASYGAGTAVARGTKCAVTSAILTNRNAAVRYLQFFDQAAGPPVGSTNLKISIPVAVTTVLVLGEDFFSSNGMMFDVGCVFGWSTTEATYTAATDADHSTILMGV